MLVKRRLNGLFSTISGFDLAEVAKEWFQGAILFPMTTFGHVGYTTSSCDCTGRGVEYVRQSRRMA